MPPLGCAVAVPSLVFGPISSVAVAVTVKGVEGSVIVISWVTAGQTDPSIVTITVYVPAVSPFTVLETTPLSTCGGIVFQLNVKVEPGFETELAPTVALPVASLVHNTLVTWSMAIMASQVTIHSIITSSSEIHPLVSVTNT
ncbi:hypothetical protein AEQU2_02191 [Aequorivita lipolytica]|nr:hypothetical protein AEQU2_02191 [Aequorivita lipolytica]